jgi:hypothetical protein
VPSNTLKVFVDGRLVETDSVPKATYQSVYLPLEPGVVRNIHLEASSVFALPHESRERSFAIKNISSENLSLTDLFARGWHRSGYQFQIKGADNDGWVDRRVAFRFPATSRFKTASVQVVRYPSRSDVALAVKIDDAAVEPRTLGLEKTESLKIPLSDSRSVSLELTAPHNFPLAAPDTRSRSYRIVNIDFE